MAYDHSIMFVRTRRNTTEGVVSIASNRYIAKNPDQFTYYSGSWIIRDSFEYTENGYIIRDYVTFDRLIAFDSHKTERVLNAIAEGLNNLSNSLSGQQQPSDNGSGINATTPSAISTTGSRASDTSASKRLRGRLTWIWFGAPPSIHGGSWE